MFVCWFNKEKYYKKKKNEVIKENMARELWAYENNYNNNNEYEFKWNVRDFFFWFEWWKK